MKNSNLIGALLVALLFLGACSQDPFVGLGPLKDSPQQVVDHLSPFSIDVPNILNFTEGEERSYEIFVKVPETGEPILEVKGLPQGAVFTQNPFAIKWKPSLQAANDPNNPQSTVRTYPITLLLSSTDQQEEHTTREQQVELMVAERFDTVSVKTTPPTITLDEGRPYKILLDIESEEFPQGPFEVRSDDKPPGTTINAVPGNPNRYEVMVNLPFDYVLSTGGMKTIPVTFVVEAPNKRAVTHNVVWRAYNSSQNPLVSAPTTLTQGPNVNFVVNVEDINGEAVPTLDLYNPVAFGKINITKVRENPIARHPSASFNVEWREIPAEQMGRAVNLNLKACARFACTRHAMSINLKALDYPLPVIDRSAWKLGEVHYAQVDALKEIALPIRDGGNGVRPTVEILPLGEPQEIRHNNDRLLIKAQTPGLKQFRVRATSRLGAVVEESFILEVFPKDRSERLLLVDTQESAETKKNKEILRSVDVANPVWQPLDGKLTALRNVLVAGSQVFAYDSAIGEVEKAAANVRNVVLLTPLLDKLSDSVKTEMEDLGVTIVGTLSDVIAGANLADYEIKAVNPLTASAQPARLQGTLTSASKAPLLLKIENGSQCIPLLNLQNSTTSASVLVAVHCGRENDRGSLILSGVEWGDISFATVDAGLAEKWVKEILP